jgi:hypothetical protein
MNKFLSRLYDKLFFKQWVIGFCRGDIKSVIRDKTFDRDINWSPLHNFDHFKADPFLFRANDNKLSVFYEEFSIRDGYGKISSMTVDDNFKIINHKVLLDTKSHLSYPFIYKENNKIFVFPEAAHSGKLSCYEFDPLENSLSFLKVIMDLPVLDPTILKYDGKYWLFGTLAGKDPHGKLYIYYSDNLLGPYTPHNENPVKDSKNGSRPAGNFINVDGVYYRPAQNCENQYGESITINKVNILNENRFNEEPYFLIHNKKNKTKNQKIFTIHTINFVDDIIVVDGMRWTFSPALQWKVFLRNRREVKQARRVKHNDIKI